MVSYFLKWQTLQQQPYRDESGQFLKLCAQFLCLRRILKGLRRGLVFRFWYKPWTRLNNDIFISKCMGRRNGLLRTYNSSSPKSDISWILAGFLQDTFLEWQMSSMTERRTIYVTTKKCKVFFYEPWKAWTSRLCTDSLHAEYRRHGYYEKFSRCIIYHLVFQGKNNIVKYRYKVAYHDIYGKGSPWPFSFCCSRLPCGPWDLQLGNAYYLAAR